MPVDEHLRRLPSASVFVGREPELQLVDDALASAIQGNGRVVLLSGEAGIGKTRLLEEIAHRARQRDMVVLRGTCAEDAAGNAYAPFRDALAGYVAEAAEATLRSQLGAGAGVIARLVPRVRQRLGDIAEPVPLQPDEERTRLLDALSQFLIAIAARAPVVLVVDDLHWADDDTLTLFRHVGRHLADHHIILLGAYREHEVEDEGALAQAVALLRRQQGFERITLAGLANPEVEAFLQHLAAQRSTAWSAGPVDASLTTAIGAETKGNPFFVRSVMLHLEEEGRLRVEEGCWRASGPLEDVALPEGVRQVLRRRIGRLTPQAQSFLTVGAAVGGTFRFDIVVAVSEVSEQQALPAVDEALKAQLIEAAPALDTYTFVHALVRQTVYEALNPSRQVRLHRQIAAAMERAFGERASDHAAEIAEHYHRSRTLPGAERGVRYCLAAAEQAEHGVAFADAAGQLRRALDLLPADAPEHLPTQARFGLALIAAQCLDEGAVLAGVVAARMAAAESQVAAANYLTQVIRHLHAVGAMSQILPLTHQGLNYAGERRDPTWATLKTFDIFERETADSTGFGIPCDSAERREIVAIFEAAKVPMHERYGVLGVLPAYSRAEMLECTSHGAREFLVGRYREGLRVFRGEAAQHARQGKLGDEVGCWTTISRLHVALGEFDQALEAREKAVAFANRLPEPSIYTAALSAAVDEWRLATDENWDAPVETIATGPRTGPISAWYRAVAWASSARTHARMGRVEKAMHRLSSIVPAIERAPGWAENYTRIACDAAETSWLCQRSEWVGTIERNLREKVIALDFRYPMMDGRLAVARLCALQERYDEAAHWFAKARTVLEEQGARPLRAITDYDEALMYYRRGGNGDVERARPLLDAALAQFRDIGMPGWIRRAETLLQTGREWTPATPAPPQMASAPLAQRPPGVLVKEGDVWRIAYGEREIRVKHSRGLSFLAQLLRHPGREIASTELVAAGNASGDADTSLSVRGGLGDAGEVLDATARTAYKRRLDELRAELEEAEQFNDSGRVERVRREHEQLTAELSRAVGIGGRERRAGSHAERARISVTRAIDRALQAIATHHPALGEHFARTIKTGTFCSYAPDPLAAIDWKTDGC